MQKLELDVDAPVNLSSTTFFKKTEVERVLVCFHGFQTSTRHDCQAFADYFQKKNTDSLFSVQLVDLYSWGDKKTYSAKMMYKKAHDAVAKLINEGKLVYLLAYSFSADIVARISVEFPQIEKICLISPTTYIIKTKLLDSYIRIAVKNIKLRIKYRKKAKKVMQRTKTDGIVKLSISIARAIVSNRKYLKKVNCKVFMTKGNKDELSISNTFHYISNKSKDAIIISKTYPNENHVMFMSLEHGKRAFDDVLKFVFHISRLEEDDDINFENE